MFCSKLSAFMDRFVILCRSVSRVMNGVKMEVDEPLQSSGAGLTCCLIDNGIRCHRPTGNASYSKRIAKTVTQRRLKLVVDQTVSVSNSAEQIMFCHFESNQILGHYSKFRI